MPKPIRASTSAAMDTAHKLAILTALAFGTRIDAGSHRRRRHRSRSALPISKRPPNSAIASSCSASPQRTPAGIEQRVHPTMVPRSSAIAQVMGVTNAVTIDADAVHELTLVGPGAGGEATASAVVADIADIARGLSLPPFGLPVASAGAAAAARRCRCMRAAITSGSRSMTGRAPRRRLRRAWPNARFRSKASCSAAALASSEARRGRARHSHHPCDVGEADSRGARRPSSPTASSPNRRRSSASSANRKVSVARSRRQEPGHHRSHSDARTRARDRTRRGGRGAAARPRRRKGRGSGGRRCDAARVATPADRRNRGHRRRRARRGADALYRRKARHIVGTQGRYRGRSARRHDALRARHAGLDRGDGHGDRRLAAACARRLYGEDRDRPRLSARASSISI